MLFVRVQGPHVIIKIIDLQPTSINTLFKLTFVHDRTQNVEAGETDSELERAKFEEVTRTFTSDDIQRSILDALRRYYGSNFIDQGMRIYEN